LSVPAPAGAGAGPWRLALARVQIVSANIDPRTMPLFQNLHWVE
jgi:hypothetical protein